MRALLSTYEADSFLHRRNPAVKLLCAFVMMVAIILAFDPWTPLAFLIAGLLAMRLAGRVPLGAAARPLLFFLIVGALGFVVTNAFFYRPAGGGPQPPLWRIGSLTATAAGLTVGISLALRMLAIVVVSITFVATTPPTDLVLSLIQNARFPYRLGYGVLVTYRFLPMWQTELETIRAAHRVRGVGRRRRELRRYAVPLLASAIRKAERVATAMDSKGFGARPVRTYRRRLRVTGADWGLLAATVVLTGGILLLMARTGRLSVFGVGP